MAVNKISMGINYRKKTNSRMTGSGNYFAEVDRRETLTTRGLALADAWSNSANNSASLLSYFAFSLLHSTNSFRMSVVVLISLRFFY